jgi:PAS domain S-box-containing protein
MHEPPDRLVGQQQYYESLIAASPTAIVTTDREDRVTSWNPAAEALFGFTAVEAIGRNVDDLVCNDESVRSQGVELNRLTLEGPLQRITRRTRKDGSLVDVSLRAAPIEIDGRVVGLYAFFDDITELLRQRRYFESLVDASPAAVLMIDPDIRVTLWNPAAHRLFGYTAEEAIGSHLDDLVANRPDIREEAERYNVEAWRSDDFHRIARRTRKDGSLVDVEISARKVLLEGETIGYYTIYHDITELEQSRRQLEAKIDEQLTELVRRGELARFLPRQVAEGLIGGQLAPDRALERRKVTALFADLVGFTDLSESLEPEELAEVLNEYLREMTAVVLAHGGTLDNFIGDGVMAVFGAPESMDETEQAWAAVRAALEMRGRCRELAGRLRARGIPADLAIRVGVNTGHCTVGVFGSEVMRAYKAVGFPVNVAARLQAAAEPDSILCGFRTYALVESRVEGEAREPLTVKGAARPVEAWSIVGLAEADVR